MANCVEPHASVIDFMLKHYSVYQVTVCLPERKGPNDPGTSEVCGTVCRTSGEASPPLSLRASGVKLGSSSSS